MPLVSMICVSATRSSGLGHTRIVFRRFSIMAVATCRLSLMKLEAVIPKMIHRGDLGWGLLMELPGEE